MCGKAQRAMQAVAAASIEHRVASSEAEQEAARQQTRHAAHDSYDIVIAVTCTRGDGTNAHTVRRGLLLTTPRPIVCCTIFTISEHRSVEDSCLLASRIPACHSLARF